MKIRITAAAILLLGAASAAFGQQDTTWDKWHWLIGEWVGEGSGAPGQGSGWFSLQPELDGKILIRKNHAEYPATKDKPQTIHDDLMIVHLDGAGQPGKAIYFDNEGHVLNYAITHAGKSIIFTSGKIGNMPVFRLTYDSLDKETIRVTFALSQDGEHFRTYTEGTCRRKR